MIETLGAAAEVAAREAGAAEGNASLDFDSSKAMDFSHDSENSNFATEKDGNKETEGQIKEYSISEQNKPDTSNPLDFSRAEKTSDVDKLEKLDTSTNQDFSDNRSLDSLTDTPKFIVEKDDNGKVYKENGELLPNNEYTVRGYDYKTGDHGQIISASGDLQWKDHEGRLSLNISIQSIGKGNERVDDDRGHLIADEFNGSNGIENLVPMNSELNRNGDYRKLEKEWEIALKEGKSVNVDIEPQYPYASSRPDSFTVGYTINGEYYEKTFANEINGGM